VQSHWREFEYMHNELKRAIDINMPLVQTIENWQRIARDLAEPPRRRRSQLEIFPQ
jgi:hypothetical protein